MEIVLIVVVIVLSVMNVVTIIAFNSTFLKLRTLEKAKDIQEVKQYLFTDEPKTKVGAEPTLKSIEEMDDTDVDNLVNSAIGER